MKQLLLATTARLFLLTCIASAAAIAPGTAANEAATVTVAGPPNDAAGEMLYAADLGFFSKAGLNVRVTPLNNTGTLSSAVASGAVDIGCLTVPIIALAREKGIPLYIIAPASMYVSTSPTSGLVALKTSTIQKAADLNGKTIAVRNLTNMSYYGALLWIAKNGGDAKSVHFIELPDSEDAAALDRGRIDAASITEPELSQTLAGNAKLVAPVYDAIAPRFLVGVYFTSGAYASAHPDVVRKFADVMAQTAIWASQNHDRSAQILGKYLTAPMLPGIPRVVYGDRLRASEVQPLLDVLANYGALKGTVRAKDLFAPEVSTQ